MKEKSSKSNNKETEYVFQQLDKCIHEARRAEQTDNWKDAWQAADKLSLLTKSSYAFQIVSNSVAVLFGAYQRNWILVMVSASAIFGLFIELYGNKK